MYAHCFHFIFLDDILLLVLLQLSYLCLFCPTPNQHTSLSQAMLSPSFMSIFHTKEERKMEGREGERKGGRNLGIDRGEEEVKKKLYI